MRKKLIILIGVSLISVIFIVAMIYKSNKKSPAVEPSPSPSPTTLSNEVPDGVSFTNALSNLNEQYPWYDKLPIDNTSYHIVYDFSENKFRIRLKKAFTISQTQGVVKEAVSDIENIGVTKPVQYYVFDSSGNRI